MPHRYTRVHRAALPPLYSCHICAAVTTDPTAHDHWHAQLIRIEHEATARRRPWRWGV